MNLHDLCSGLNVTLMQLEAARRGADQGAAIDQRQKQWTAALAALQAARSRADWLEIDASQVQGFIAPWTHTQDLAEQAAQRLEANPDIDVLTQEDLWVRLLQTAQSSAETLAQAVRQRWAELVAPFSELTPVNQLRASASPVPQNQALLEVYETDYRIASRLASLDQPRTDADPQALAQSLESCRQAAAGLRFDVPAEVETFFRAVNAGGASMTLVTSTVLAWLGENDQLRHYMVRGSAR
jgi:hypothetical protein